MTVQTLTMASRSADNSAKSLNTNNNSDSMATGSSFNATLNQTASEYGFDDQRYLLSDGQVLTAEQLLEMLENGNSLPGLNLPSLNELQQFKFQAELNKTKTAFLAPTTSDKLLLLGNSTNTGISDKFVLTPQHLQNQQIAQNQLMKSDGVLPEQFLVTLNAVKMSPQHTIDNNVTGLTAIYGYQMTSTSNGTNGLLSNSFSINTPVQNPQWNQSLGQSVQWMVNQNIQQAEIKLNPPDLGLLDIRISVTNDQATVNFSAANAAVRDALESAMPRLRDMLEQSGISLADVNVSEHSLEQNQQQAESEADDLNSAAMDEHGMNSTSLNDNQTESSIHRSGLLDIYA